MALMMKIGSAVGNTVWIDAPSVQLSGLTYRDRAGNRTYDAGFSLNGVTAADELSLSFN
jgi:hypothetical protein